MSRKVSGKVSSQQKVVNITLLGALGSGKSAIVVKFLTRKYIVDYSPEIEDKYCKVVNYQGENILVNVLDTCDREDLDLQEFTKWSDIILVVYSITSRASYYRAKEILDGIHAITKRGSSRPTSVSILVSNKIDMERTRLVSRSEGEQMAEEFQIPFFECSVIETFDFIDHVFRSSIKHFLENRSSDEPHVPHIPLTLNNYLKPPNCAPQPISFSDFDITSSFNGVSRWIRGGSRSPKSSSTKEDHSHFRKSVAIDEFPSMISALLTSPDPSQKRRSSTLEKGYLVSSTTQTGPPSVSSNNSLSSGGTSVPSSLDISLTPRKLTTSFRFFRKPK